MDDQQAKAWNGPSGQAWVEAQGVLDQAFRSFEELLADEVSAEAAARVLDVGCGTGSTTLAVARRLGPQGRTVGVDISEPMLALARARAERESAPARFIRGDAQTHAFPAADFDTLISRFGVMFFDDPVRAFKNLRHATREGGALRFIVWRSPDDNPFMTTAERAAAPLLPQLTARETGAPGQFALADRGVVERILHEGGFKEIEVQKLDLECAFAENALVLYLSRLGPVGRALDDADEGTRSKVVATVRAAFDPYVHGAEVRFTAACWLLKGRAK